MSKFQIPLVVLACILSGVMAIYASLPFGFYYTFIGAVVPLVVGVLLLFFLLKYIVFPIDAMIDRREEK